MKLTAIILLLGTVIIGAAQAGIVDPDCTAKKAVKSAATKAVVGVGGRCNAKEAVSDTVGKKVDDVLPDDGAISNAADKLKPEEKRSKVKKVKEMAD